MKAKCPKCGCRGMLEHFADTSSLDAQVQEWRVWLRDSGHWVSPDGRVKTEAAALLLGRSVSRLRAWRQEGYGPDYGRGKIATYRLEDLASFYLTEILCP